MKCSAATAIIGIAAALGLAASSQAGPITYVDAQVGGSGNTTSLGGNGFTGNDGTGWEDRTGVGTNNSNVFETTSGSEAGDLQTTVTVPSDATDVYVFYWDAENANSWQIDAGLTSGSLTNFVADNYTSDPDTDLASNFTYENDPTVEWTNVNDTEHLMYASHLGQATSTTLDVFIGSQASGNTDRTWYDGIGYAVIPEPASLALLAPAGLLLMRRRR